MDRVLCLNTVCWGRTGWINGCGSRPQTNRTNTLTIYFILPVFIPPNNKYSTRSGRARPWPSSTPSWRACGTTATSLRRSWSTRRVSSVCMYVCRVSPSLSLSLCRSLFHSNSPPTNPPTQPHTTQHNSNHPKKTKNNKKNHSAGLRGAPEARHRAGQGPQGRHQGRCVRVGCVVCLMCQLLCRL